MQSGASAQDRESLLFYAPFDEGVDAAYSLGSPKVTTLLPNGFRAAEGIRGKCVVFGGKEENEKGGLVLQFSTKNNIVPKAGTISFWSKALDWDQFPKFDHSYHWLSFGTKDPGGMVQIYRYGAGGMTTFRVALPGKQTLTWSSWPDWRSMDGTWNHVAFTWSPDEENYYLNGGLQVKRTENLHSYGGVSDFISLGEHKEVSTAVDELYIFKKALSAAEVQALYRLGSGELQAPHFVIGQMKSPPVVDGKIEPDEWKEAAVVDNFIDGVLGVQSDEQVLVHAAYDETNLFLALHYAIPEVVRRRPDFFPTGPLHRKAEKRDADMRGDDSYEIVIATDDNLHRFRINALGTMADDRDGDTKWNGRWKAKSFDDVNVWTVEAAIPFADLGLKPDSNKSFRLNIRRNWIATSKKWAALAVGGAGDGHVVRIGEPGREVRSFPSKGDGTLGFAKVDGSAASAVVRIKEIGDLSSGSVLIKGSIYNPGPATQVKVNASAQQFKNEVTLDAETGASSPFEIAGSLQEGGGDFRMAVTAGDKVLYSCNTPYSYSSPLAVERYFYPSKSLLEVTVRSGDLTEESKAVVRISRAEDSESKIAEKSTTDFKGNKGAIGFDTREWPHGTFTIHVALMQGQSKIAEQELSFTKKELPVWHGTDIGKPKKVPPPWTPIEVSGERVSVWGREYQFDRSLLFSQVVSAGGDLLAGPVRVLVKKDGQYAAVKQTSHDLVEKSDLKTVVETAGDAQGLSVSANTLIEFDGFTWTTLRFQPKDTASVNVEAINIEVPFDPKRSTLYYVGDYSTSKLGGIKPWKSTRFVGWQWLGDEEAGMQWYAQSDRNWWSQGEDGQVEILPGKQENLLRLKLMTKPTTLSEAVEIKLGFMATPVTPKRPDARRFRNTWFAGEKDKRLMLWFTRWGKGASWPELKPMDSEPWVRHAEFRAAGLVPHLYVSGTATSPFSPDYREFQEEWRPIPSVRVDIDTMSEGLGAGGNEENRTIICPKSSFQDFLVYWLAQAARDKERDIQGYYFDNTWAEECMNEHHGCGYVGPDGERRQEMPILADREMFKRIYVSLIEANPDAMLSFHMSGQLYMPMLSFAGIWLDGEQFASGLQRHFRQTNHKDYYDYITLDKFRTEFMGHQWGGQLTYLLSEYWNFAEPNNPVSSVHYWMGGDPSIDRIAEHLSGMQLVHDVQPTCGSAVSHAILAAQDEFGWDERVEFLPYWDSEKYVTIDSGGVEPVICSVFKRENEVMLVLFNDSDQDAKVTLKIHFDALGVKRSEGYLLRDPIGYNRDGGGFAKGQARWASKGMQQWWSEEPEIFKSYGNTNGLFLLVEDSATVSVMKRNYRVFFVE